MRWCLGGGRWIVLVILWQLAACAPASSGIDYIGMNFNGDRLEWTVDPTTGDWTVLNRDLDLSFEGSFVASSDAGLEEFQTAETDAGRAWVVERPGRGLVTSVPTGEQGIALNWSASTAVDLSVYQPLIEGNHSCVRFREDGAGTQDIVFLTLRESDFSLLALDSAETHFQEVSFGVSSVEAGEGEVEGTWELGGLNQQEITLQSSEGTWEGVLFPGTMLVLRSPIAEGVLACMWSPLPNTQLSVFDGDYQFLESRIQEGTYGAVAPTTVEVFGNAGELVRPTSGDAGEEHDMVDRGQVYYVGNLIVWQTADDTWLYQAVAADFYLQWTQQTMHSETPPGDGSSSPPRPMSSFGIGFHPRELFSLPSD